MSSAFCGFSATSQRLLYRREREIEIVRLKAIWKARRTFWFDIDGPTVLFGGRGPTLLEQVRGLREGKS